jgi:hypothetical protein
MRKAIKRIARRIFILILVAFALYLLISNIDLIRKLASEERISVIVDADGANGADDLLAIARILEAKDLDLKGLLSGQWRMDDLNNDSTVETNTSIHRFVIREYDRSRIPLAEGHPLPLFYRKEHDKGRNRASDFLVRAVYELSYQEKLNVLCLGSATNLADAILQKPEIAAKINCYILGPFYEPVRRYWDKSDPVTRLDLEAMNVLLDHEDLEIHLLPANVASGLIILKSGLEKNLYGGDSLRQYLYDRLIEYGLLKTGSADSIPCPSLALAEAFLNPDMSTRKQLIAPPENAQRKIYVFTRIDSERMKKDLWKMLEPEPER